MRKAAISWMVLLVILIPIVVGASSVNVAEMTDDELISLNRAIIEEVISREKTATIPVGWYVVGEDLPAGTYLFQSAGDSGSYVGVFKNIDTYKKDPEKPGYEVYVSTEHSYANQKIVLEEGNVFSINRNSVFVKKFTATIEFK